MISADHPTIFAPYLASANSDTIDGIGRGDEAEIKSELVLVGSPSELTVAFAQSGTSNG